MRLGRFSIAALAALLCSGCAVLDGMTFGPPQPDPNKVYLGRSIIAAQYRELDRYACMNGPMICESITGMNFTCRCPE